jgi:hypothetical protein
MGEEAMPVEGLGGVVPGPVGLLGVGEDDGHTFVELVGIGPDVEVALWRAGWCLARRFEPGVLVRCVIDDKLDEHLHVALVGGGEETLEVVDGAVGEVDAGVVGYIVAVVPQWRGEEGQEPEAGDAQVLEIVETRDEARKVADAVTIRVLKGADVELIEDRVFVPQWVGGAASFLHDGLCRSFE